MIPHIGKEAFQTGFRRGINFKKDGCSSRVVDGINPLRPSFNVATGDHDLRASLSETVSKCAPKNTGGSNNDGNFLGEIKEIHARSVTGCREEGPAF